MDVFTNVLVFMAGVPAIVGLVLTAVAVFLTSDWRLSLTSLLVQYLLVGLVLTRFIQAEVAIVKILVGVMVVLMLYLSVRRVQAVGPFQELEQQRVRLLGLRVAWGRGPLGLPLRLLVAFLVAVAVIRFSGEYYTLLPTPDGGNPTISPDVALAAFWLGCMGLVGLILSGEPDRVAPAVFTTLAGFELIYAGLETNLAIVGFWEAFILLAALALSYLIVVRGLATVSHHQVVQAGSPAESLSEPTGLDGEVLEA